MSVTVSIVVCAYTDNRFHQLCDSLNSLLAQTRVPDEVIAVIDHNPSLQQRIADLFPRVKVIPNQFARGNTGGRNSGIVAATGDIVGFIDDDAKAEPDWLAKVVRHYDNPNVIGVGGRIVPMWRGSRPQWMPEEFNWVVGCSYIGQPTKLAPVRNPIGCNMSFRRDVLNRIGMFKTSIGRVGNNALACDETELSIRARQTFPDGVILYDPEAVVHHEVTEERMKWAYFRRRCVAEGVGKTQVVEHVGSQDGLAAEKRYLTRVIPSGILRGLMETVFKFDPWGVVRSAGIVAGVGYTVYGYATSKLKGMRVARPVART